MFLLKIVSIILSSCTFVSVTLAQTRNDFKKMFGNATSKGNACIARFESGTSEPLYYTCPRQNESEKKIYCCYLDKCCDYKEFQKQLEQQYKQRLSGKYGVIDKGAIGRTLKWVLGVILAIIIILFACCIMLFFACRKKKLFTGKGLFESPLPAQPPGPSPYATPTQPYVAYDWHQTTTRTPRNQTQSQRPPAYSSSNFYPSAPP